MSSPRPSVLPKLIALVLLGGAAFGGWKYYSSKPKDLGIEVRTYPVAKGDITQAVTANGQINPVKNVAVGSQVSGIIEQIFVDFNSTVTNGQLIAVIDPSNYEQSIVQSTAELANTQAALELAQLNFNRAKDLHAAALIPKSDFDRALADLHQAEASAQIRESSLRRAKLDLSRTHITAPVDGVVISRNVDVGQTVAASFNTPTLFQIAGDLRKMQIEAMVSEADVGGIEVGQKVTFQVDAFATRQFRGQVKQVRYAPITNQNVVNYISVIDVDNSDLKLRPGMTANASIITSQKKGVIRVPNSALRIKPPEGVILTGETNAPAKANVASPGGSNTLASAGSAGPRDTGGAGSDERRRRFESMTPEQREQFRAMRGGGPGGPGGPGGRSGNLTPEVPVSRTVYLLEKSADENNGKPIFKAIIVKAGISDGAYTEITEGLKEGDNVISTAASAVAAANRPTGSSPFGGSPFGGGMRPPGR